MMLTRPHHQLILELLSKFNSDYLVQHGILFGGGTRIALELFEYRESIDIDFLCADSASYRAVRSQVTSQSLGFLLKPNQELSFPRGIRADRDAVRTFVQWNNKPIKLEFVHFDYYDLTRDERIDLFPVPAIDHTSCFLTKILANADRYADASKKDVFDLCMMAHYWGGIPEKAWTQADEKYGFKIVYGGLVNALTEMIEHKQKFKAIAVDSLAIVSDVADSILNDYAPGLLGNVLQRIKK